MKKLSIVTILVLILSLMQNVFFPTNAKAAVNYQSAKGIVPTYVEGNDPNYGLPWIKINPDGSYEVPDKFSSEIKIVKVIREGNVYNITFDNGNIAGLTCTYDQNTKLVAWSSTLPVHYVFMKAGPGGLLYDYSKSNPLILDDSRLGTPEKKDLSHVNFYFKVPNPPVEQFGSLKVKKIFEGEGTYPKAYFTLKDKNGAIIKKFELVNNQEITINELDLNREYVLYEDEMNGYEVSIIDSSSKEVKLTAEGYTFKLTKPEVISLVVKNKKIIIPPDNPSEDQPVINPEVPGQLPKTGSLWGTVLPILGMILFVGGVIVFISAKRK